MAALATSVALRDPKGNVVSFPVGTEKDDLPPWAAKAVTNKRVWDDFDPDAPDDDDDEPSDGPPPKSGKGSGIRAWRKYAEDNGVDVEGLDTPDEVWAKLESVGVQTEGAPAE